MLGRSLVARCDISRRVSSLASLYAFQHEGFPFFAKEPVLSAPVKAWKAGSAAVFRGPRALTIG